MDCLLLFYTHFLLFLPFFLRLASKLANAALLNLSLGFFDMKPRMLNDRNKHGGGVAMYIKEGIKYIVRSDLPIHNLELICIEVQPLRSEPFNIVSWYRPPNAPIDSFLQLEKVLAYIDREGKETIL